MQLRRIAAHATDSRDAAVVRDGGVSVLLLPGAWQRIEDFSRHGFEQTLHERAASGVLPAVELILAAPEQAHLNDRAWLSQLHDAVVAPERAAGRRLWLGGISLGAFRALRFAADYPDTVDGLCLLAPYLGSRIVAAEIGGGRLQDWQPGEISDEDDERRVWRYLRDLRPRQPEVFLGLGSADRFADTQQLLARSLPEASSLRLPGGHDWPVWCRLWENFLDRLAAAIDPGERLST